jgi:PIN domain nuclease of toxin-antitoxin system
MSWLLDTHALVWWLLDPDRLSKDARDYIKRGSQRLFVSTASVYEIEYKRARDASLYRFPKNIPASVPLLGFEWLPIEAEDGFRAARLTGSHRDPWDRIIAAQAWRRRLGLITKDIDLTKACRDWGVLPVW